MNKQELALKIINDFFNVFKIDNIDKLDKMPKLEKTLFDKNKDALDVIVEKYISNIHESYDPKNISYYDRKKIKNYPYTLFKKLYECNDIKIKTCKQMSKTSTNNYSNVTFCYI